jgi:beta-N-acetylhexosaminidase
MMMAHLLIDALDTQNPTTVSPAAYEFLRKETKFSKIVITDDMEMKAIADRYSIEEAAYLSVKAGADMLLYRFSEDAAKALQSLKDGVKSKRLTKDEMLDKIRRVEKTKEENLKDYKPVYIPKMTEAFNSKEAKDLLDQYKSWQDKNS